MAAISRPATRAKFVTDFARIMGEQMEAKGLGCAQLAQMVGMSRQHVYRILRGDHTPNIATAEAIAQKLGMKLTVKKIK